MQVLVNDHMPVTIQRINGTVLPIFLLTPASVVLAMNFSLVGLLQELDLAPEPPPGV